MPGNLPKDSAKRGAKQRDTHSGEVDFLEKSEVRVPRGEAGTDLLLGGPVVEADDKPTPVSKSPKGSDEDDPPSDSGVGEVAVWTDIPERERGRLPPTAGAASPKAARPPEAGGSMRLSKMTSSCRAEAATAAGVAEYR